MAMPIKKNNRTRASFVILFSLSLTLEGREALYSGRYMCVSIYIYIYIFFFFFEKQIHFLHFNFYEHIAQESGPKNID